MNYTDVVNMSTYPLFRFEHKLSQSNWFDWLLAYNSKASIVKVWIQPRVTQIG